MNRLIRWLSNDPIHGALTVGFGAGFASYTLELLHRAIDHAAEFIEHDQPGTRYIAYGSRRRLHRGK